MILTSPVFQSHQKIPSRFTGEGQDVSPPLEWSLVPSDCKGFALICEDPDASQTAGKDHPFVHWVIYNISGSVSSLPEGLPQRGVLDLPVSAAQGKNSFGNLGYNGPMPPIGHGTHHYEFTLYAIDRELSLPAGLSQKELLNRIRGWILNTAKLTGTYERASAPGREAEKRSA